MPEVQLKEGTVFEAVDKLRNKFLYRFERVDARTPGPGGSKTVEPDN